MKFAVVNLGCKVNRVESDEACAWMRAHGWEETEPADAALIVVNTCTVTGEADRKTRKAVNRAIACANATRIVVTGCSASLNAEYYASLDARVEVVPKAQLLERLAQISDKEAQDVPPTLLRVGDGFNTRIGVKVQDGCAHACTYCIVHVARGLPWSKPASAVRDEVRAHVRAGVREVVLTGINLGSYRDGETNLAELLSSLLGVMREEDANVEPGQEARLRLSSIEPMDVDARLIQLLANAEGRICRHLHLPVQSGSTKVLREMERPYTAEDFLALVERLRSAVPSIALSTDIIAGFPGETTDDFAQSVQLCRKAGFMRMHVFAYSRREGTPAAARADQISPEEKAQRAAVLRELARELCDEDLAQRCGTTERALVMPENIALTESYHEMHLDARACANARACSNAHAASNARAASDARACSDARPNTFIAYRFA